MKMRPVRLVLSVAAAASLALGFTAYRPLADGPTVVIVVRHAEKEDAPNPDPALNATGQSRAAALAQAAEDAGVTAVYTTQFRRARDTGAPLAQRLGVQVTPFEINGGNMATYPQALRQEILSKHKGETVVVVGHSNTVPALVQAFSGKPVAALTEADYDRFFVVVMPEDGQARVIKAQYGH
jgi:broad specificity phosphatase PhoE